MTHPVALQVAGGSVRGTRHREADRNNQDAFFWDQSGGCTALVVTDGCSQGRASEVGAHLGASVAVEALLRQYRDDPSLVVSDPRRFLAWVHARMLGQVREIVHELRTTSIRAQLQDFWLYTVVGALVSPESTLVFVFGDGVAALNGEVKVQRSPGNAPQYPMYGIAGDPEIVPAYDAEMLWCVPTSELHSLLLGTDGVEDWITQEGAALPGKDELLGPLSQFWTEERYVRHPDALRRRLAQANRSVERILWEERRVERDAGRLPDDTTLIVLRQSPAPEDI